MGLFRKGFVNSWVCYIDLTVKILSSHLKAVYCVGYLHIVLGFGLSNVFSFHFSSFFAFKCSWLAKNFSMSQLYSIQYKLLKLKIVIFSVKKKHLLVN